MSDEFNGISLNFTINIDNIDSLRNDIRKGLKKEPIKIENIEVSPGAINTIRSSVRKAFEERALSINKLAVTNDAISSLRASIRSKLKNNGLTINNLKAGNLSLKGAKLTNMNDLRKSVGEAISAGAYSVKITHVDASEAIKRVQSQLTQALNASGFGGIKEISASSKRTKATENTPQKEQLSYLTSVNKELGKIETSANRSGLLGRSDVIKASIGTLRTYIADATKSIEQLGIQGDIAFNRIKTGVEKDMAAIRQMVEAAGNPILANLTRTAEQKHRTVSSGKDAITDIDTLTLLDSKWRQVQGAISEATDLVVKFADPAKINQALLSVEREVAAYSEMASVLKELNRYDISTALSGGVDIESWKEQLKEAKDVDDRLTKLKKKLESATTVGKGDISGSENFKEIEARFNRLIESRERLKAANTSEDVQRMTASFHEEARAIEELIVRQRELATEQSRAAKQSATKEIKLDSPASAQSITNLASQMQAYLSANSAIFKNEATKAYASQIQSYINTLEKGLSGATVVTERSAKEMGVSFKNMKRDIRELGVSGQTLFERFTKGFEKFGGWMIITSALMEGVNIMHQAVANVFELDKAMTELKKVTDETATSYENFFKTAEERSKVVGSTLTDLVNATADFSRLGYNMTDAEGLAETAILYKNVGDNINNIEDATQSIVSTLKAFYEANDEGSNVIENAGHIIDAFNETANNFSISSDGIGQALQRSAAALSEGGNTMEESISLIVAANEIAQDPEKVGNKMRCRAA